MFLFASAPPIRYFGLLSLTALAAGLAGDCVLLPVLLRRLKTGPRRAAAIDSGRPVPEHRPAVEEG